MALLTYSELQKAVGEWGRKNFGENICKHTGHKRESESPLWGIGEEIGEFYGSPNEDEDIDALCDIGIYLMDYLQRENLSWDEIYEAYEPQTQYLPPAYGKMLHATLKRSQGIRGFDDPEKYKTHLEQGIRDLMEALVYESEILHVDYLEQLNKVASKVLKRDWVTNPTNAADVAEDVFEV